jgi:ligand-binding sensor domain-containing protein
MKETAAEAATAVLRNFLLEAILCLKNDGAGGFWAGTAREGAYHFRNGVWTHLSAADGLADNNVWDVFPDHDTIWFCSRYQGLCRWTRDSAAVWTRKQGLTDREITVAQKDGRGVLWVGSVWGGLCGFRFGAVQLLNRLCGRLSGNYIRCIVCDSVPRWVGSWDGGLDYFNGSGWEHIPPVKPPVTVLVYDPRGRLWAGTWGSGVFIRETDGTWDSANTRNSGLPDDHVIDIKFDRAGKAYFATNKGVAVWEYLGE